jgi:hypothetical protein
MRNRWKILFLIIALILSQTSALAWGDTAHMVIAQIAYSRLNPTAKEHLEWLAPFLNFDVKVYGEKYTYNAITVAAYMDDLRIDPSLSFMNSWHFFDKPFSVDGTPINDSLPKENAVTRLQYCIEALKSRKEKGEGEAQLVAQLIHLVGDVHQPLHCASRFSREFPKGDNGGNLFLLRGGKARLHSYWDAAGGLFNFEELRRPLNLVDRNKLNDFALAATSAYPETDTQWKEMSVDKWADESFNLAVKFAYADIEPKTEPNAEYRTRTQDLCRKRLAMAGYRLAALLNEIYPESSIKEKPARRKK